MFRKGHTLSSVHNVVTPGLMGGHSLVVRACGLNCYIKNIFLYSFLNLGNIAEFLRLSFNGFHPLADPEGGGGGCNPPPLNFQKRGVASAAVMISTVSTVSEQERNGQGRRETVGKSVYVRQAMQLKTLIT